MDKQPSLLEFIGKFNTEDKCIAHFARMRWPGGVTCIKCGGGRISEFDTHGKTGKPRHLFECMDCKYQFSVTVNTVFHNSHVPLTKWFVAIYLMCSAKKGVSAKQLERELRVNYRTAWYMAHRIRLAMQDDYTLVRKLSGIVEVDETYVGGKGKKGGPRGRGTTNKIPVLGIRERTSGEVRMQAVKNVRGTTLANFIRFHSKPGSEVHTDEFSAYRWLDSSEYAHRAVNHSERYVDGPVHVNGVENLWSLFKRGVMGSFHKVSEKYLPLYLSEFEFRFNNRKNQATMFDMVLRTGC